MEHSQPSNMLVPPSVVAKTEILLREHQTAIWKSTDYLLSWLLGFEWLLGITLALWRSPRTWHGAISQIHPHIWAAIFLGGGIAVGPVVMAIMRPGRTLTRHTIAIGQMLMSGLLIHLGDGQIEMHFQIFGALAFLAFYRDWRVLFTASVVTAADHLLRGLFAPFSIYGVDYASLWLTAEHTAFVVFEDIFLIGSCLRGVREMRGIAENRALLEHSYHGIEEKVQERTDQLKSAQAELMSAARSAGMAEIATSVLHNVGNVLNSVNISATIVTDRLRDSEVASLGKVGEMITEHRADLGNYLTADERGSLIPEFINDLAHCLCEEQRALLAEVENLNRGIDHIKQVVAAQQSMAKKSNVIMPVKPQSLMDRALGLQPPELLRSVSLRKHFEDIPEVSIDEHKVLQILVNLISNAHQAVMATPRGSRQLDLSVQVLPVSLCQSTLRFKVADNGSGIAAENLTRVFSHGFTTKKEGHGFGLHSAANAAIEMGGTLSAASEGANRGAVFTLDLPFTPITEEMPCK